MSESKKGEKMQSMKRLPLPIPKLREKKLIQAKVEIGLRNSVVAEAKKRNIEIRQLVEFGLKQWLLSVNPKEAARIGIVATESLE